MRLARVKLFRAAWINCISALFFVPAAGAFCPSPPIKPNGEFFKRDIVFIGTVVSVRYTDADSDHIDGWFYQVRVERLFKGPVQSKFTIYTENSSVRLPLEQNHTYLLFADRTDGRLVVDSCGNSGLLSKAGETVQSIERISHAPPNGEIEGWVIAEIGGRYGNYVSGVRIAIRDGSKVYTAITDKDGRFHFRVPAGRYSVDFDSSEHYLDTWEFVWYDAHGFPLHAGETASLQLVLMEHQKD